MFTASTPKERMAVTIWNLQNEIATEKLEEPNNDELSFIYFVRENSGRNAKMYDLENQIKHLKDELGRIRAEKVAKAYWESPEGVVRHTELHQRRLALINEDKASLKDSLARINEAVSNLLGSGWKAFRLSQNYTEIGMLDPEKENSFIFGNDIDVYYDPKHFVGIDHDTHKAKYEEKFEFSVGSTGSFSGFSESETDRAAFYLCLGKLLSDKDTLEEIKNAMRDYCNSVEEKFEAIGKIDDELKHPFKSVNA